MERNKAIAIWVGIIVVFGVFLFGVTTDFFGLSGASTTTSETSTTEQASGGNQQTQVLTQEIMDQLETQGAVAASDIVVGTGEEAVAGKLVTVNYTGVLPDGTKFDSSLDRGTPFQFVLGAGQVIQGWEIGVNGMKVGGRRQLVIPPSLAYGERAIGAIPANSTLIFDVELLDVAGQQQ
jgi:peptidylprolyl isomerase